MGFETREDTYGGSFDSEKQGYEENLSKFKGWSWDSWTFFINIVDGRQADKRRSHFSSVLRDLPPPSSAIYVNFDLYFSN